RTRVAASHAQRATDERGTGASGVGTPRGGEPDLRAAGAAGVTATTPSRAVHPAGGGPGAAADADRAPPGAPAAGHGAETDQELPGTTEPLPARGQDRAHHVDPHRGTGGRHVP